MIISQQLGDPAPYDRSIAETLLGAEPGYLAKELGTLKTLLVVQTALIIGSAIVSLGFVRLR